MGLLHATLSDESANFYAADVYLGALAPPTGQNIAFSMSSIWGLSQSAGTLTIRVEFYWGTDLTDVQTFTMPKVTTGSQMQRFAPAGVFFLADDMNAKFYLRSSDANDNTDYGAFLYLYDPTGNKFLDSEPLIDGKTVVEALRIISAILAGKVTGAGTGSEVFRSLDDTSNRVSVTVDAEGNRTAVTY